MSRFEAISLDIEGSRDELPLGLGVNSVTLSGVRSQFLRAFGSLFYAGQPGHLALAAPQYCFADTAGTTPAVLGGQVARVNSPVPGQPHLVQVTAAARPILGRHPSVGGFSVLPYADGWTRWVNSPAGSNTLTSEGNSLRVIKSSAVTGSLVFTTHNGAPNTTYTALMDVEAAGYDWCYLSLANTGYAQTFRAHFNIATGQVGTVINAPVSFGIIPRPNGPGYRVWVQATTDADGGNYVIAFGTASADGQTSFLGDGVSGMIVHAADVQKRPGPFAPKRLYLSGGIRNLIALASTAQTSENFGAWAFQAAQSTREQVAGKGSFAQGWRYRDTSATENPALTLNVTPGITTGRHVQGVFFSYDFDQPPSNGISLFSMQGGTTDAAAAVRVNWNLDGTVSSVIAASATTEAVGYTDLGDGLYFAWARANFTIGAAVVHYIWPASFVAEGTSTGGIIVYGAQIERSDFGPSPYQRVTSAFDITEADIPDAYYLQGDGVDDHMTTSETVNMSTLTKARLVAGLEKFTDVNSFYGVSHGLDASGGNLSINKTAGNAQWTARSRGTGGLATSTALAIDAPDRAVLTADVNRATNFLQLRYNNAAQTASAVALGGSGLNATLAVLAQPNGDCR
jgi:hypothetical protein